MEAIKRPKRMRIWGSLTAVAFLFGCSGPQSALQPAGVGAEQIAQLFWWMGAAAIVIWVLVIGFAVYITHINLESHSSRAARWLIVGGGAIVPPIVLGGLLVFGLQLLPTLSAPAEADFKIAVSGEQWWWRVQYQTPSGQTVELANEIWLPVGERVEFSLSSPDVIHSFWIPSLGGKVDMIPGRTTRLVLEPTKTGVFRGACAEFCGTSHALMNFQVKVVEPAQFDAWLKQQAEPAAAPQSTAARQGLDAFLANGCGACHSIRGTAANGVLGPDLTHVGSRLSLGADVLPNNEQALIRWISDPGHIKPDVNMPAFGMLPEDQLTALAAYLGGLK